jgi:hypothetical protein
VNIQSKHARLISSLGVPPGAVTETDLSFYIRLDHCRLRVDKPTFARPQAAVCVTRESIGPVDGAQAAAFANDVQTLSSVATAIGKDLPKVAPLP